MATAIELSQEPQIVNLTMVQGDDYTWVLNIETGTPLVALPWAGVTIDECVLATPRGSETPVAITTTPGASGVLTCSLTEAQTALLTPGDDKYVWWLVITTAGYTFTYAKGTVSVLKRRAAV
jgi:hypothetical protein